MASGSAECRRCYRGLAAWCTALAAAASQVRGQTALCCSSCCLQVPCDLQVKAGFLSASKCCGFHFWLPSVHEVEQRYT